MREQILRKHTLNPDQIARGETVILTNCNRTPRNIQSEYCFVTTPDDMNMRRAMVIWVNSHTQSANPQYGWHEVSLPQKPKRLGYKDHELDIRHYFGAVVSVVVLRPPPSMLTLSSWPWKIKAAPDTLPRAGSVILGGTAAVPVST